jgi:hypothetical protein
MSGQIRVVVLEEHNPLGELVMEDIPSTVPIGTPVEVAMSITKDLDVYAKAYVPTLGRSGTVTVKIPPRPKKTKEQCRARYEKLAMQVNDWLADASPGVKMTAGKAINQLMAECKEMLHTQPFDGGRMEDAMDQVKGRLVPAWKPKPRKEVFDGLAAETSELLKQVINQKPQYAEAGYEAQLDAICTEARTAYAAKNSEDWSESFARLEELHHTIEQLQPRTITPPPPPPPPAELLMRASSKLDELKKTAERNGRYQALASEFGEAAHSLRALKPDSANFQIAFADWWNSKLLPLQDHVCSGPDKQQGAGIPTKKS